MGSFQFIFGTDQSVMSLLVLNSITCREPLFDWSIYLTVLQPHFNTIKKTKPKNFDGPQLELLLDPVSSIVPQQ